MAITIEIIDGPTPVENEFGEVTGAAVQISLTDGAAVRTLNVGDLPASVLSDPDPEAAALALLNERAQELWDAAGEPTPKTLASATQAEIIRALALVMMNEINILRRQHQLADRTPRQVMQAVRNRLNNR